MSNTDRYLFRVWNGDMYSEIFSLPMIYSQLQKDGSNTGLVDINGTSTLWKTMLQDGATIEQCTGLKDKNGKLIFENDYFMYNGRKLLVGFDCGSFVGKWHGSNEFIFINDFPDVDGWIEVVGNFHEAEQTTNTQGSITIKDPTKIPDYLKL